MLCNWFYFVVRSSLGCSVDVMEGVAISSSGLDMLVFGSLVGLITIQYNTIQYNTIQYNTDHFGSIC
jgi:hypothetical protein